MWVQVDKMENNLEDKQEDLFRLDNGKTFVLKGSLSEELSKALNEEYKKDIDEATGIVLESQVFQTIQKITDYINQNKNELFLKDNKIGVLFSVDNKDVTNNELLELSGIVSTMDNNQVRNSSVIIKKQDDDNLTPISVAIENFCRKVNIPIHYNLKSYIGNKKVV